jgi:hypothetical protein
LSDTPFRGTEGILKGRKKRGEEKRKKERNKERKKERKRRKSTRILPWHRYRFHVPGSTFLLIQCLKTDCLLFQYC